MSREEIITILSKFESGKPDPIHGSRWLDPMDFYKVADMIAAEFETLEAENAILKKAWIHDKSCFVNWINATAQRVTKEKQKLEAENEQLSLREEHAFCFAFMSGAGSLDTDIISTMVENDLEGSWNKWQGIAGNINSTKTKDNE